MTTARTACPSVLQLSLGRPSSNPAAPAPVPSPFAVAAAQAPPPSAPTQVRPLGSLLLWLLLPLDCCCCCCCILIANRASHSSSSLYIANAILGAPRWTPTSFTQCASLKLSALLSQSLDMLTCDRPHSERRRRRWTTALRQLACWTAVPTPPACRRCGRCGQSRGPPPAPFPAAPQAVSPHLT